MSVTLKSLLTAGVASVALWAGATALALADSAAGSKDAVVTVVRGSFPYTRTESLHLLSGSPPAKETTAVTLTDTDCQPDAHGISHCVNELRLADGSVIVLRHDHAMHTVPCLSPGERVTVKAGG